MKNLGYSMSQALVNDVLPSIIFFDIYLDAVKLSDIVATEIS